MRLAVEDQEEFGELDSAALETLAALSGHSACRKYMLATGFVEMFVDLLALCDAKSDPAALSALHRTLGTFLQDPGASEVDGQKTILNQRSQALIIQQIFGTHSRLHRSRFCKSVNSKFALFKLFYHFQDLPDLHIFVELQNQDLQNCVLCSNFGRLLITTWCPFHLP